MDQFRALKKRLRGKSIACLILLLLVCASLASCKAVEKASETGTDGQNMSAESETSLFDGLLPDWDESAKGDAALVSAVKETLSTGLGLKYDLESYNFPHTGDAAVETTDGIEQYWLADASKIPDVKSYADRFYAVFSSGYMRRYSPDFETWLTSGDMPYFKTVDGKLLALDSYAGVPLSYYGDDAVIVSHDEKGVAAVVPCVSIAGDYYTCEATLVYEGGSLKIDDIADPVEVRSNNAEVETEPALEPMAAETPTEVVYALDSPFTTIDEGAAFDAQAFAEFLGGFIDDNVKQYYPAGTKLTARITNLDVVLGDGDAADEGIISLNGLELHSGDISNGFNEGTFCGCELWFFYYYTAKPGEFYLFDSVFNDDANLHIHTEPAGNSFADYTLTVDAQYRLLLVKAGQPVIVTPAKYYGGAAGVDSFTRFLAYGNGGNGENEEILLVTKESGYYGETVSAYKTIDGGQSWTMSALDAAPTTTDVYFSPENAIISRIDDQNYWIMLCTSRAEAFVYKSTDMGQTFERICNFKMLNYRVAALESGGFVAPGSLGVMCFSALEDKPNPNVYITTDGGYNWSLMSIAPPESRGFDENWRAVGGVPYLDDTGVTLPIYADGETFLYRSADGGRSWAYNETGNADVSVDSLEDCGQLGLSDGDSTFE